MISTEIIGLVAGTLTTASFVPQVYQIIKTRDVAGISLFMYIIFTIGVCLWLLYGFMNAQISVIMANGVTLVFAMAILFMKLKYNNIVTNRHESASEDAATRGIN
jgi:MtN3 and saliva related transmembrane protein